MFTRTNSANRKQRNISHNKSRCRVSGTARLNNLRNFSRKGKRKIFGTNLFISFNNLNSVKIIKYGTSVLIYLLAKSFEISASDRKTRSKLVSAVFFKKLRTLRKRGNEIKALDTPPRSLTEINRRGIGKSRHASLEGNKYGRHAVTFGNSRSYYTDNTVLPILAI